MPKKKALEIFHNLKSQEYTAEEKLEAVIEVAQMPTHNSVKKADMVDAILFMADLMRAILESESTEE